MRFRTRRVRLAWRSAAGLLVACAALAQGRAIDVRLSGVPSSELRKAAVSMRAGGVGYYPSSNFIHIDTGRVRQW